VNLFLGQQLVRRPVQEYRMGFGTTMSMGPSELVNGDIAVSFYPVDRPRRMGVIVFVEIPKLAEKRILRHGTSQRQIASSNKKA